MRGLGLFLHVAGVAVWLGASLTFMVFGPAAKRMPLESWANTWITLARVQRILIAPACAVATVTGLVLTMGLARGGAELGSMMWLMVMQALGLIAAVLTIGFATPLANRMAAVAQRSLDKGAIDPAAERARKVLATIGSVSGVLILMSLYFALVRP